jgi:hypothetical protein
MRLIMITSTAPFPRDHCITQLSGCVSTPTMGFSHLLIVFGSEMWHFSYRLLDEVSEGRFGW